MSNTIKSHPAMSLPGSALRRATLALGFAILPLGCSNDPEIAGKAILTRGAETYVLQTGNEGKESITSDDEWSVDCTSYDSLRVEFADKEKHEKRVGFSGISIHAENDLDKMLPDIWNMYVNLDDLVYDGICPISPKIHTTIFTKLTFLPLRASYSRITR